MLGFGPRARAARAALVLDAVAALTRELGAVVEPDGWTPAVQGAVAHVVGVRVDGVGRVAKVFGREGGQRAATEVGALLLAGKVDGLPVPDVLASVPLAGGAGTVVLLSRLPGARWSDRRALFDRAQDAALVREAGTALRRTHSVPGDGFGPLPPGSRLTSTVLARTRSRLDDGLSAHAASGGSPALADRVRALVRRHEALLGPDVRPVLCHHDLNGGNTLVDEVPRLVGVVDWERAAWDDPAADLALTALHLWHHGDDTAQVLLDAYGLDGPGRARVDVHLVLLAVAQRAWVAGDRPQGWEDTVDRLTQLVLDRT